MALFATSHGKNSCDGIGGSIKRTVRRASLQRPYSDQILDLEAMHTFCIDKITIVKFVLFSKTDMEAYRQECENNGRYVQAKSILDKGLVVSLFYSSGENVIRMQENIKLQ